MTVTIQDLGKALRTLDLSGKSLCVHSSLRSFGWVEGGAKTVVDGLLAESCTLLVPTFSWDTFGIPPPPHLRPARNGSDYGSFDEQPIPRNERVYTCDTMAIDDDMGAIPTAVIAASQRVRGYHPLCSFSAIGQLASQLISRQAPLNVFAPLKTLAEVNGFVLLMGVSLEQMTLIHLAEQMASRNLFRRWANDLHGKAMMVEVGGCSSGFGNFESMLSPLMRIVKVGQSLWRVFTAKETLEIIVRAIGENSQITGCDEPNCGRCNDAIMGGPILC